jgi:hypothetical protein
MLQKLAGDICCVYQDMPSSGEASHSMQGISVLQRLVGRPRLLPPISTQNRNNPTPDRSIHIKRQNRIWCHTVAVAVWSRQRKDEEKWQPNASTLTQMQHCMHAGAVTPTKGFMYICDLLCSSATNRSAYCSSRSSSIKTFMCVSLCRKLCAPSTRMRPCIYATCRQPVRMTSDA